MEFQKKIIVAVLLVCSFLGNAQVGIGTSTPAASAQLDVASTNKGFLPPRIALTSTTDITTIASPVAGLMVYNTATAGTSPNNVSPGIYFYTGTAWASMVATAAPAPVPTGQVNTFAGSTAPTGYLLCDGAAISRTTYASLFTIIGTTYGTGDGATTFNVPDLRGRVVVGAGQGTGLTNRVLGSTGGEEAHVQDITEMATHTHISSSGYYSIGYSYVLKSSKTINVPGATGQTSTITDYVTNLNQQWQLYSDFTTNAGGGVAANVMNPYLALNYIIKF